MFFLNDIILDELQNKPDYYNIQFLLKEKKLEKKINILKCNSTIETIYNQIKKKNEYKIRTYIYKYPKLEYAYNILKKKYSLDICDLLLNSYIKNEINYKIGTKLSLNKKMNYYTSTSIDYCEQTNRYIPEIYCFTEPYPHKTKLDIIKYKLYIEYVNILVIYQLLYNSNYILTIENIIEIIKNTFNVKLLSKY